MAKKSGTKAPSGDRCASKEALKPTQPTFEQLQRLAAEFASHLESHGQETVDLFLLLMKAYNDAADNLIVIHYMTRAAYAVSQDCEDHEGRYLSGLKQRFCETGGVS